MSSHETWEVIGTDGRGDKNNVVRGNEWIAYTANEVTARRIAKLPDLERRVVELEQQVERMTDKSAEWDADDHMRENRMQCTEQQLRMSNARVAELETLLRQSEEQNDVLMQTLEDVNAS